MFAAAAVAASTPPDEIDAHVQLSAKPRVMWSRKSTGRSQQQGGGTKGRRVKADQEVRQCGHEARAVLGLPTLLIQHVASD